MSDVLSPLPDRAQVADGPPTLRDLSWQSVVGAFLVSSLVAGAYPYIVLKLGFGPNASVVSAFLGAIFLNITASKTRGRNRFRNNIIQTAGTSAASTAFMCVVAAAFGYLDRNETIEMHLQIGPWPMFLWLTCSGMIGVMFTVIFRKHFLDDPKMTFASGIAAAETILVLDTRSSESRSKFRTLGIMAFASGLANMLRETTNLLPTLYLAKEYRLGFEWSFLNVGSGLLVGLNVGISMLLGSFVTAFVIGPWVIGSGIGVQMVESQVAAQFLNECKQLITIASPAKAQVEFMRAHCGLMESFQAQKYFPVIVLWAMWPATSLMVAATVSTLVLKWRLIVEIFRDLQAKHEAVERDIPLWTLLAWAVGLTLTLALIQYHFFGMSIWQTAVAVAASLPLMIVGIRVQGETNIGPVSAMANALQAVFAVFWPTHLTANLIAAGIAGNITSQGEGMIQDYRTGKIVGSTPSVLTYVQLASVPIGAAAVAIMYPLLVNRYGLGGDGLSAPTGLKIANMATLLSKGVEALPSYALFASVIAVVAGIILSVIQDRAPERFTRFIPSVTGFGFALILPGVLNIPIAVGGIAGWIWMKTHRPSYSHYAVTVASGMIAGEALLGGLVIPLLAAFGVTLK